MSPLTHDLAEAIGARIHRRRPRTAIQCRATGWPMATAATDGHGHICCPECDQPADVTDLTRRAVTIDPHQVQA